MTRLAMILMVSMVMSCAAEQSPSAPKMSDRVLYADLPASLQDKFKSDQGREFKVCENLVYYPPIERPGKVTFADGPAEFYDLRTGELIMTCDYWYCSTRHQECKEKCPPEGWTCEPAS